jgi:hypothetical protein
MTCSSTKGLCSGQIAVAVKKIAIQAMPPRDASFTPTPRISATPMASIDIMNTQSTQLAAVGPAAPICAPVIVS